MPKQANFLPLHPCPVFCWKVFLSPSLTTVRFCRELSEILHFEPGTGQIADSGRVALSRKFHTYLASAVLGIKALDGCLLSNSHLGFAEWSPFSLQFLHF